MVGSGRGFGAVQQCARRMSGQEFVNIFTELISKWEKTEVFEKSFSVAKRSNLDALQHDA